MPRLRRIENSAGQVFENGQGEEVTWGQQAAWVDYPGASRWRAVGTHGRRSLRQSPAIRPTGTCAVTVYLPPTPLASTISRATKNIDASLTIPGGDKAVFRYRLIIHPGRSVDGHPDVRQLIEQFQRDRIVSVEEKNRSAGRFFYASPQFQPRRRAMAKNKQDKLRVALIGAGGIAGGAHALLPRHGRRGDGGRGGRGPRRAQNPARNTKSPTPTPTTKRCPGSSHPTQ